MLVDDDAGFRDAARELFTRRGYAVLGEAACAAAARAMVERCAPDLGVVDVRLGDDSGFELASALRRANPGLAVVLTSADQDLGDPDRVSASGARGFIAKSQLATADLSAFL